MLFDRRVALTACGLVVVADQFWQFALSGLPQMLMLFLFSCTALCLVIAIKAKARRKRPFLIFFPLGICLGLMALTHPATLWLTAGTLPVLRHLFSTAGGDWSNSCNHLPGDLFNLDSPRLSTHRNTLWGKSLRFPGEHAGIGRRLDA